MNIAKKSTPPNGLVWPKLIPGILIKRYKRFMVDVRLPGGEVVTAHCPNSGSMQECCLPGRPVYLSFHDNPKRKLKYTWELIEMPTSLVGINTLVPNRLVAKSIETGWVEDLKGYYKVDREVKISNNTRLDILLSGENGNRCYVEIKNCTLVKNKVAFFPDAVTSRGLKHLVELSALVSKGFRSVIFYVIQRMDAKIFQPADHIHPEYGKTLRQAVENGVEILVYDTRINLTSIRLNRKIHFKL